MKLKDLIAVCDKKYLTIAIAPSYFTKNKDLYDLAEKTRHSDAYSTFYRETDNSYITAVLTANTPLLDHNKFLHLYKDDSLVNTFADMTIDHMEPTQYAYDQEAIRVTLNY